MRPARTMAVLSATAFALTIGACSAPVDSSSADPENTITGPLNIACSQQEDFCQAITAAFTEQTGIQANYVRLGSGEVLARLETTPGEFDVWSGGQAENHLIADDRGFVERYISPNASALPPEYNDADGIWSGFYTDSIAFCVNQVELDRLGVDVPSSWDDLLDPALRGSVSLSHPATAGVGYMAMYTIYTLNGYDADATLDYFTRLNSNILQYSKSAATGTEQAGRGEVAVAIALDSDCRKAELAGFSDLSIAYPLEGTGYEVGAISLLTGARNLEAAKVYFDWILTTDAQNLYQDVPSYAAPTLPDAELGADVPPQDTVNKVDWDLQRAAGNRDLLVELFETVISSSEDAI
jgi:iron(III) transport system substrate-binding protein